MESPAVLFEFDKSSLLLLKVDAVEESNKHNSDTKHHKKDDFVAPDCTQPRQVHILKPRPRFSHFHISENEIRLTSRSPFITPSFECSSAGASPSRSAVGASPSRSSAGATPSRTSVGATPSRTSAGPTPSRSNLNRSGSERRSSSQKIQEEYSHHGYYVSERTVSMLKNRSHVLININGDNELDYKTKSKSTSSSKRPKFVFRIKIKAKFRIKENLYSKKLADRTRLEFRARAAVPVILKARSPSILKSTTCPPVRDVNHIHNQSERMRRIEHARQFLNLKSLLPLLAFEQSKRAISKYSILKQAAEYCKYLNQTEARLFKKRCELQKKNVDLRLILLSLLNPHIKSPG